MGAVHRGKRPRPHTDEEGGHRRGPRVRGKRRQDTERHHAPRLHPQHHQPLGHRGPRDGHVRQRGVRPRTPGHLFRPGIGRHAVPGHTRTHTSTTRQQHLSQWNQDSRNSTIQT